MFATKALHTIVAVRFVRNLRKADIINISADNVEDAMKIKALWEEWKECKAFLGKFGRDAKRDLYKLRIMDAVIDLELKSAPFREEERRKAEQLRQEEENARRQRQEAAEHEARWRNEAAKRQNEEEQRRKLEEARRREDVEKRRREEDLHKKQELALVEERNAQFNRDCLVNILSIDIYDDSQWRRAFEIYDAVLYAHADIANDEVKSRIRQVVADIENIRAERGKKTLAAKDMQLRMEGRSQRIVELEDRLKRIERS